MAARRRGWVVEIENMVNGLNLVTEAELWVKQSIYRVPGFLKELNPKAYKPQVVSFGPYHHGDPDVSPMEEHKLRALLHFLKRANKPLDDFVRGMEEIVQQLQGSYQDLDQRWRRDRDRFLQLMIVDGCFMLEVMRVASRSVDYYSTNDPIFSNNGMMYNLPHIHRDMLMVENQLPLLVLKKLYVQSGEIGDEGEINELVLRFVACNVTTPTADVGLGLHPLDLYRKCLIQSARPSRSPSLGSRNRIIQWVRKLASKRTASSQQLLHGVRLEELSVGRSTTSSVMQNNIREPPAADSRSPGHGIIRSALELDEAGIQFKKSKTNSLKDITFYGNVLSLPVIVFDDSTEFVFLNLMAFERLHVGAGNEVTSYVFFMDDIIDSAQDVSLLRSKGIIKNLVGSDKALANIVNALSKEAVAGDSGSSNHDEVNRKLNDYCQKKWNRWRANLIRTYFRSPWSFLSLLAAIFLLALTFAQTLYTIPPIYL